MRDKLVAEFAVNQVVEKGGSGGYVTLAVGHFSAPPPARWDEVVSEPGPEFFPSDVGIGAKLELDWSRFAGAKPAAAYYGTVYRVTLEVVSVPVDEDPRSPTFGQLIDKTNGGLKAPIGRRV